MGIADLASVDFIRNIPKVELHVHLEGSVTPDFWFHLIQKHDPQSRLSLDDLRQRFQFNSFTEFLLAFRDVVFSFVTPDDFFDLTERFLANSAAQSVKYCEVMMTPWFLTQRGIDFHEMMAEIDRAARIAEQKSGIQMRLIFDGPRNFGNEVVKAVFDQALSDKTGRVIGVGLGGDEVNFPAIDFKSEFAYARAAGLKTIAHAGETAGETSMIHAITELGVSRMGHCLGIAENSALHSLIIQKNITLELCPQSNLATKVLNQINDHPFFSYLKRGYSVTLNSDDPGFFDTSISKEYLKMAELHQLTTNQIRQVSENAVNGAFLSPSEKQSLVKQIRQYSI